MKISTGFINFVVATRFSLNETLTEGLVILLGTGDIIMAEADGGETVNVLVKD